MYMYMIVHVHHRVPWSYSTCDWVLMYTCHMVAYDYYVAGQRFIACWSSGL